MIVEVRARVVRNLAGRTFASTRADKLWFTAAPKPGDLATAELPAYEGIRRSDLQMWSEAR